jgi:hypothetical protein
MIDDWVKQLERAASLARRAQRESKTVGDFAHAMAPVLSNLMVELVPSERVVHSFRCECGATGINSTTPLWALPSHRADGHRHAWVAFEPEPRDGAIEAAETLAAVQDIQARTCCKHDWICTGPDEYAQCSKCHDEIPWTGLLQEAREAIEVLREQLAFKKSGDPRLSKKPILGYRVLSTDKRYVVRVGEHLRAEEGKSELYPRAYAYRLAADWMECGYLPIIVRVMEGVPGRTYTFRAAEKALRKVYSHVMMVGGTQRSLIFYGGLVLEEKDGIKCVNGPFQLHMEETGEYRGRVGAVQKPIEHRGSLDEVVRWLCGEGARLMNEEMVWIEKERAGLRR